MTKQKKMRILWGRLILVLAVFIATLIAFGILIHSVVSSSLPSYLHSSNRRAESIVEKNKSYIVAAYYPRNVDGSIKQRVQEAVDDFLSDEVKNSREKEVLLIDYRETKDMDFTTYDFYISTGEKKDLKKEVLFSEMVNKNGDLVNLDTLFEGEYLKQIAARVRKALPQEERDLVNFFQNTQASAANYADMEITSDGITFCFDKSKLYKEQSGEIRVKIPFAEMSYYLKESINGVDKTESDAYHARYIDVNKPMVALTYDDGPYSKVTSQILDLLEEYDSVATFFVVGKRVGNSYDNGCVERAIAMGCDVGNHTRTHEILDLTTLSAERMLEELLPCEEAVKKVAPDYEMTLMRPTGGTYNSTLKSVSPYVIIRWSVDTQDWSTRSADAIYQHVMTYIEDGDIILMHDLYEETLEATKRFVPELINKYQFVSITELFEYKGIETSAGQVYVSSNKSPR